MTEAPSFTIGTRNEMTMAKAGICFLLFFFVLALLYAL